MDKVAKDLDAILKKLEQAQRRLESLEIEEGENKEHFEAVRQTAVGWIPEARITLRLICAVFSIGAKLMKEKDG